MQLIIIVYAFLLIVLQSGYFYATYNSDGKIVETETNKQIIKRLKATQIAEDKRSLNDYIRDKKISSRLTDEVLLFSVAMEEKDSAIKLKTYLDKRYLPLVKGLEDSEDGRMMIHLLVMIAGEDKITSEKYEYLNMVIQNKIKQEPEKSFKILTSFIKKDQLKQYPVIKGALKSYALLIPGFEFEVDQFNHILPVKVKSKQKREVASKRGQIDLNRAIKFLNKRKFKIKSMVRTNL